MEGVSLGDVGRWIRGQWHSGREAQAHGLRPQGVSTDTRHLARGDLFLALRGPHFDGHQFLGEAFQKGACAAVVERAWIEAGGTPDGPAMAVDSPLAALGALAREYRKRFRIPVVAVVGSSGKTTTKELIASVLGRRYKVLKTPENENAEIGVPRTLLQLTSDHSAVVVELGARREGDIRYLCSVAQPSIGVLLNVGSAHLELFESVERVAKAKGELLDYIEDESSLALVNADDRVVAGEAKRTKGRLLGFGLTRGSHFSGEGLVFDREGRGHLSLQDISIDLKVPGRHNVYNALAAAAVGCVCGVPHPDIGRALGEFEPLPRRSEILRKNGICIINDCYNANPVSVTAAIGLLCQMKTQGRRVLVLGDMLELGAQSRRLHEEIGRLIAASDVDVLLGLGDMTRSLVESAVRGGFEAASAHHFDDSSAMSTFASNLVSDGDVVLVKGSRGMHMEAVVDALA